MLPDFETLVKRIKSERKEHGWTQKQLAKKSGVSQSLIAKLERKENIPNYKSIRKIYNVLEKNIDKETAGQIANPKITNIKPDDKVKKAAQIMLEKDYSQIPVKKDNEYIGMILSKDIVGENEDQLVKNIMRKSFPLLPENTSKKVIIELLKNKYNAVLIKYENEEWGMITAADLI